MSLKGPDYFILAPNALGVLFALAQLALYGTYCSSGGDEGSRRGNYTQMDAPEEA